MQAEVVAHDLGFVEGPTECPSGAVVVTSVDRGVVWSVTPASGRSEVVATTGGGPNAAALTADGAVAVTQNGGFDFSSVPEVVDPHPTVPTTPGIQVVGWDGSVADVVNEGFQSPNDLAAAGDGCLYFTDPPRYPPSPGAKGRVWSLARDGSLTTVGGDFEFCNGIAVDADGSLVVVERRGLVRVRPGETERETIVEDLGPGGADGLCIDEDGRLYVAATTRHGIRVVEDGEVVDFLELEGDGMTTNCCFGGPEQTTLYVADGVPGRLLAFEGMPTPGLPAWRWPVPGRGLVPGGA